MRTLVPVLVAVLLLAVPVLAQNKAMLPADRLNELAKTAHATGADTDIKALADKAVDPFGIPKPIAEQFRVQLVQSEQRYRQGKAGVTEDELVSFHNRMVKALNLPEFAETDQRQVRDLRMTLQYLSPELMSPQRKHDPANKEVDSEMSPLQAAHLESMMIFQKYMSPMYQLHPREWSVETANKIQDEENQKGSHLGSDKSSAPKKTATKPEDDKTTQLANSLQRGVNSLSIQQGLEVLNDAVRTFKF